LRHVPFPYKYKYILKNWLNLEFVEFESNKIYKSVPQGRIMSPLLMNFILNGMEILINKSILKYNKIISKSSIKKFPKNEIELLIKYKWLNNNYKKYPISCELYRYANDFVVLCGSKKLLALIKKKFTKFLQSRGLKIYFKKSKTILFKNNTPFNFLGYTFIYFIHTKHKKKKFLRKNKREYPLENWPKLFTYPSNSKLIFLKKRLKTLVKYNLNSSAYVLISILNSTIKI
jgi:RNA-directed DNA polymerase